MAGVVYISETEVIMELGSISFVFGAMAFGAVAALAGTPATAPPDSFFALKANSLSGKPVDFAQYRGKVVLAVNVASKCGYTPQYKGLQALATELSPKGLVVLGFPSNEFGAQEPGTAEEIATFCQKNYGVTFAMFAKGNVKPGPDQSPVYAFLTATGNVPSWNFCKYVVGKDGKVKAFFPSKVAPDASELRELLIAELAR
jgi:glutathione peroxidase